MQKSVLFYTKSETDQFNELVDGINPVKIYGVEHLIRLIGNFISRISKIILVQLPRIMSKIETELTNKIILKKIL